MLSVIVETHVVQAAESAAQMNAKQMQDMRKLLDTERARTQSARSAHAAAVAKQGDLHSVLQQLVDHVQARSMRLQQCVGRDGGMLGARCVQSPATGAGKGGGRVRPFSAQAAVQLPRQRPSTAHTARRQRPQSAFQLSGSVAQHGLLPGNAGNLIARDGVTGHVLGQLGTATGRSLRPNSGRGCFGKVNTAMDTAGVASQWTEEQLDALLQVWLACLHLDNCCPALEFCTGTQCPAKLPCPAKTHSAICCATSEL